jgi:hypothetical protein
LCNRVQNVGASAGGALVESSFCCLDQVLGFSAVSFICLVLYSRVNSVVPYPGVAAAWGGVQAPPDHLYHKFYVMYIRVINIEPIVVG